MATLQFEDGHLLHHWQEIVHELASQNIQLKCCSASRSLQVQHLLLKDVLTDLEKGQILHFNEEILESLRPQPDFLWYDLMTLHPGSRNLMHLHSSAGRYHTHTAPEAIILLVGSVLYGFVRPDGSQIQLLLHPQEYLYIPAGAEHWFAPTALLQFKLLRYFTTAEGWLPHYTGTEIRDMAQQRYDKDSNSR